MPRVSGLPPLTRTPRTPPTSRVLAWVWLLLIVAAAAYNANIWLVEKRGLETDFLALLPVQEHDPVVRRAFEHVAEASQQDLLVLVGAREWTTAQRAAQAYADVLQQQPDAFAPMSLTALTSDSALAPWWSARTALLTGDDRARLLSMSTDLWVQRAMQDLISPVGTGRIGAWQDDPFGTFRRWLRERAADSPVRPMDGMLRVDDGDMRYAVLPMRLTDEAFALSTQRMVTPLLDSARVVAQRIAPDVRVLAAGMVFPAAAAAAQANREFSTIGWGSIIGIILITWITFRSLRPIGLILLSLGVGTLGALAVTAWWYADVHLLTLVFGASLIGVAEDYGMHYLCIHDRQQRGPWVVMRESLPGLALALLTTIVSFIGLGVSPFPGLQQMAVFSAIGLFSAWLTVVLWFPLLDGPQVGAARVVAWFDRLRVRWEQFIRGRGRVGVLLVTAALMIAGVSRLRPDDDIRLLQSLPPSLLHEQTEVGRVLQQPFNAQFFLVRDTSADQVLVQEESLRMRLDSLVARGTLSGYQAVSSWVPSSSVQQQQSQLVQQTLLATNGPLDQLRATLDEDVAWSTTIRTRALNATSPITIDQWLTSPISQPLRPLWLGAQGGEWVSVVTLKGVDDTAMQILPTLADGLAGVRWADQVASISTVLRQYRVRMSWVLIASYVVIWLFFVTRFGASAWRILAPSVTASIAALAVVGLLGHPLQLFHILGLYLVFGIGVDYAIFLTERTASQGEDIWFAVGLAATSTVLSLGLLALSSTPVLRAFGLTMLVGVTVSMMTAPLFCTSRTSPASPRERRDRAG